ncbi:VOC family protein [Pseudonocardia eucalypti]|uniref:VOC family protein n=1 Tax=Pseudonocardia eucalypti TaxID=648755 RepID=A0ABP9QPV2_9PSEU|nr:catechol 2,3-dioxygenase-like lactoylglutathione lyase family enzyme [Pseudonocardia eucalypti]
MELASVTVGLPVSDLPRATEWYRRVFDLGEPDLEPAEGVVEFQLGPIWLQLGQQPAERSGAQVITRFGVADAKGERERLIGLGVEVGPLIHVPDAVDYCDFADPDGNVLSLYTELT